MWSYSRYLGNDLVDNPATSDTSLPQPDDPVIQYYR